MEQWRNGDSGETVKKVIDSNFDLLERRINQNATAYLEDFLISDWVAGIISIDYSKYNKTNPCVNLYIKTDKGFEPVLGGYAVTKKGIEIWSDIPYEGRVVVK